MKFVLGFVVGALAISHVTRKPRMEALKAAIDSIPKRAKASL